ncbi:MAG: hypothetical protein AB4426_22935 [Xenococcaceae cyanobacterium]
MIPTAPEYLGIFSLPRSTRYCIAVPKTDELVPYQRRSLLSNLADGADLRHWRSRRSLLSNQL